MRSLQENSVQPQLNFRIRLDRPGRITDFTMECVPLVQFAWLMSAFGGKADLFQGAAECPLIAKSGHTDAGFRKTFNGKLR